MGTFGEFFGVDPKSLAIIIFIWIVISLFLFGDTTITPGIVLIGTFVTVWLVKKMGPELLTTIAVLVFGGFIILGILAVIGRTGRPPPF